MLHDRDLERYARQVILPQIGEDGQEKLFSAKVLLVGLGGLGCPAATYLALAGVRHMTLVDNDVIELSNLPRQTLFEEADIGRPKAVVAAERLGYFNSAGAFEPQHQRFDADAEYGAKADLWIDATDHYASRTAIAEAAGQQQKTLITAAAQGFQGHIATLLPGADNACFHGLYPHQPQDTTVSRCEQIGIFGAVAGMMGMMLAQEVVREVLGLPGGVRNRLLLYDGLYNRMQNMAIPERRRDCLICQ